MREIKFRAWDKLHKRLADVASIDFLSGVAMLDDSEDIWRIGFGDIVMEQYAGLKDKNGKKIYEGGIIKYTSEDDVFFYAEVKYFADDDDYPAFDFIPPNEDWYFQSNCLSEGTFNNALEVVGNIHQNADLLEAEK